MTLPYRAPGVRAEDVVRRLLEGDGRGALVGPEGSGKTTLLENLGPALAARDVEPVFLYLNRENRAPEAGFWERPLRAGQALLVDGGEVLSPWGWSRLQRHAQAARVLVATLHRPARWPVMLPTLHRAATSVDLLSELLHELGAPLSREECVSLWQRHRGNIRTALRELYDRSTGETLKKVP